MGKAEAFVERFLRHYASPYYDPVKAREYYLRTRELKGRKKGMSEEARSAWDYTKTQINEAEKRDLEAVSLEREEIVERARETARARRDALSYKLRILLEAISAKRVTAADQITKDAKAAAEKLEADLLAESERIREDAAKKIAGVPDIPEGVSGDQRARLVARRAEEIAKIRGTAFDDLVKLSDEGVAKRNALSAEVDRQRENLTNQLQEEKQAARDTANAEREEVRTELKATVDRARADYESKRDALRAQYDATEERELEGIQANLPSAPSSGKSSPKKAAPKKATGKKGNTNPAKPGVKTMTLQEAAEENVRRLGLRVPRL